MNGKQEEPECCPKFDPTPWDGKIMEWNQKRFIQDKVSTLFYMPLNFGSVMVRMNKALERQNATCQDWLCLSEHTSMWNMNLLLAVNKEIPEAKNTTLSGKFLCKVYEGPFKDTGKWGKDYDVFIKSQGMAYEKMYMWYTTCPKCAKKYGKNYVVILGRLKELNNR